MSGLLLMFLIKRAKKVVWASVKVVESLSLAILMNSLAGLLRRLKLAGRIWRTFGRVACLGIVDDKGTEECGCGRSDWEWLQRCTGGEMMNWQTRVGYGGLAAQGCVDVQDRQQ